MAQLLQSVRAGAGRASVVAGQVAYVAVVYLVVVALAARVVPGGRRVELALTFLAVVVVTVTLPFVADRLRAWMPASVRGPLLPLTTAPADPGDRLAELSKLTANALGPGVTVQIRAALGSELAATWRWPRDSRAPSADAVRRPLVRAGHQLGQVGVDLPPGRLLTPVEERLLQDAVDHAALVLETARLDRTLAAVIEEAGDRHRDLQESRVRILSAMEAERRRVERDIHDGAQQHLVALVVNLRLLRVLLDRDPARARTTAVQVHTAAATAIDIVQRLSAGLYPPLLVHDGPAPALAAAAAASPVPVLVQAEISQRWDERVERAAYFSCLEALQNAIKHAEATRIVLRLAGSGDGLTFEVADDGRGYDLDGTGTGSGSANLRDRVSAIGGHVDVTSAPGGGTTVSGWLPARPVPAGG